MNHNKDGLWYLIFLEPTPLQIYGFETETLSLVRYYLDLMGEIVKFELKFPSRQIGTTDNQYTAI